ncbi:cytochrome b561 [Bradyrhizobium sp. GM7.3]|jgi:cytochrome b561
MLKTALTGWRLATLRGWPVSLLNLLPPPTLASDNAEAGRAIDGLHQAMEWTLLVGS